jgi:hypothetical protein
MLDLDNVRWAGQFGKLNVRDSKGSRRRDRSYGESASRRS